MSNQNFTVAFLVEQNPQQVFNAINNVRGWWTGQIEGETNKLGDEWTYRYKDFHYSKLKITELVPGKKIVWHVLEAELTFTKDKREWTGTDIVFEITNKDGKTEVRFTHVGLVPQFECYDKCSNAWGGLVGKNLCQLIETISA